MLSVCASCAETLAPMPLDREPSLYSSEIAARDDPPFKINLKDTILMKESVNKLETNRNRKWLGTGPRLPGPLIGRCLLLLIQPGVNHGSGPAVGRVGRSVRANGELGSNGGHTAGRASGFDAAHTLGTGQRAITHQPRGGKSPGGCALASYSGVSCSECKKRTEPRPI
jgi:hypothetical protein